ncbi:hypothetical protein SAMN05446927_8176 [Caballeronia arationis]|jgi:hypothetical protein|uniref:Uncharacterized protein n=1 Tax=Caballeronia arationis TaxID=1777142 RepID=A0A7Z7IET5_9BURK|nr:hypothetical protein SAMN05446927_8176 [Caballeronia arationis]
MNVNKFTEIELLHLESVVTRLESLRDEAFSNESVIQNPIYWKRRIIDIRAGCSESEIKSYLDKLLERLSQLQMS